MEFLVWHYTKGFEFYITSWNSYFTWINHYFSLPTLLLTLFAPWKRLIVEDKSPGFNLTRFFENLMFNLISRVIGATVRFTLFWVGIILIIFTFLGGILGLGFWVLFPLLSLGIYRKQKRQVKNFIEELVFRLKSQDIPAVSVILDNEAGDFVVTRCGVNLSEMVESANLQKANFSQFSPSSYKEVIEYLIKNEVWDPDFLRKKELEGADLVIAASWWDKKRTAETEIPSLTAGRPGIGLELLFGYTPYLNLYSIDLSAPQEFSHHLIGRQEVVLRIERTLTAGSSVVLIGAPGVGKKTVVLEFAHRAAAGELGPKMAYRRVLEFDYNALLSEATDLNQKKTKLAEILSEASTAGNIILMIRDIHRITHPSVEGYDFTDILEEHLERRELKIVAVATPTDYERFIAPNLRLRKYLEKVEVTPPTSQEAMQILVEAAGRWESQRFITVRVPALRHILEESDRYITETPFPEKALELLDAVVAYVEQKGEKVVTVDATNAVLAEKTGISFARLTSSEKKLLSKIEEVIHKRLINQEAAIDLIGKSLRARTVGVSREARPIGSFLFLGPTGVGKTETAKVLAKVYYGSEENILRFDMAEFAGSEGLERLIGSVSKDQPGALTTAIKNKPASLLLLDEIEKASPAIYNLFLTLLDEGVMTDAFGKKINGRHLFVIGTSNAGAEYIRQLVSGGVKGGELQKKVVDYVLKKGIFSPEFLNRFDGVVVYEPLTKENLVEIAQLMLKELAQNLKKKNIYLEIDSRTIEKLAEDGYDPAFGARPMRRIVNLILGDLLGRAILKEEIKEGDRIKVLAGEAKEEFRIEKIGSR